MEKERLQYLLQQRVAGKATAAEEQELSDLVEADTHPGLFKSVLAEMMQQEAPAIPASQAHWQKMVQDIVAIDKSVPRKVFRLYRWVAAAAVILIAGAIYYFVQPSSPTIALTASNENKLTFSDGKQVMLDEQENGIIATLGNITITKKDNQIIYTGSAEANGYHVLSTARGSNYEIILADGSQVSLNASSSLRFPIVFSGDKRSVDLAGEAWFDVQHADRLPFAIQSGQLTTTVLGTAFDIRAYPGENNMMVSVQRGKVKVEAANKILATLEKGQQVKLIIDSAALVQRIDTLLVGAWKQGNLNYEDEPLHSIVADLQRVFKDSIAIQNAAIKDVRITGRYHKKDGLQQILTMISNLGDGRLTKKNGIFIIE